MENKIMMIKIERLHPHPKNPRKNIGDVTELAESIKKSGILQNLTVVPYVSELTGEGAENEYTVIIGHRRMAAAKQAGFTELPCAIKEMTAAEQLATMLAENVQRNDLTPFEQAEGIQMMFDIGETVADVVKKTGLSESTVRRRSKLLEMDMDKLRATEGRGATLADYERLNQIKDIKKRNELLEDIGTNNFENNLSRALTDQRRAENKKALEDLLGTFAEKVTSHPSGYDWVKSWDYTADEIKVDIPDDAKAGEYVYYPNSYAMALYKKRSEKKKVLSKEEQEEQRIRREKDDREMERRNKVKELARRAYELRKKFIEEFNPTAKDSDNIKRFVREMAAFGNVYGRSILDDESLFDDNLDKSMLEVAYWLSGDSEFEYIQTWNGRHTESEETDKLYECLERLGYQMSDDEKKLQDGSHEFFEGEEV